MRRVRRRIDLLKGGLLGAFAPYGSGGTAGFLVVDHRRIDERAEQQDRIVAEHAGADGLRALVERFAQDAAAESAWLRATIEFRAVASRDPQLNRRYAAAHSRTVDRFAAVLARLCAQASLRPLVPAPVMAEFILALSAGMVLEWAANPAALPSQDATLLVYRALGFTGPEQPAPLRPDPGAAAGRATRDSRRAR